MKGLLIVLFSLSVNAWADPTSIIQDFKALNTSHKVGSISEQAFCYNSEAKVEGYQVDRLQRLASITKILTTFFASEALDLNKKYTTKLYITPDRLHIEGSRDPYFEEEKLLLLMKALNSLGYKAFKNVTFNSAFTFSDAALSSHMDITPTHTKARLAVYFKSTTNLKGVWAETRKFAEEEGVYIEKSLPPSLSATTVSLSEVNPTLKENPIVYTHTSRPLHSILKSMNVMSKNIVSQNVYLEASKVRSFAAHMLNNNIPTTSFNIKNGSGLPIISGNVRFDNLCSCRTILSVMNLLKESLKKHSLSLSQVMAVAGGKDLGSFRERFLRFPEIDDAVLAKTGTLKHSSALAGFLEMDHSVPFAILNHTVNMLSSRKMQDEFVANMFHFLGNPVPLTYEKISIFPVESADFLTQKIRNRLY